ncbi:MAG: hypothetical protein Q8P67_18750, partial [archaeon]|nr:hypothetical protein [archaeon]
LQVFKSDAPPSIHGIGSRKEGLSLLGIVSGTKSTGGEQTLRRWMRYPSKDLALLEDRLDSVGFLKSPLHSHVIPQVQQSLRQVKDLNRILSRVTQFVGSLSDWDGLSQSLVSCLKVKQALMGLLWANDDDDNNEDLQQHQQPQQHQQGREAVPPLILKLLDLGSSKELLKLASIIYGTIDVEQSRRTARITVKQGVNETLDDLRYTYDGLDDFLHNLGLQQLQRYQREIAALKCVYYPQKGFAIAVPAGTDPGALERSLGFVHQFSTEQYHYFKNDSMRTVDRQLGDVYCEIVDLEKELLRQLAAFTARYSPAILEMYDLICQLDACIALSLAASHFNWVRPELLAQGHGCLQIDAGRHPLLEYCLTQSIPNDVSFDRERIKVVTGPNASGKSVFLKQVALIAFMAHIGSYVPASRARISVVDRLFTRISSRESVSVPQGTFMIDLCQVADILNHASSHSLVIMDEFGKGTHELDGQALLAATLRDLLHRHSPPPRVLVATHMDEVFRKQLISGSATAGLGPVGYYTMAYHIAKGFEDPVFLYKVIRGASLTSLATTVARLAGIPKDVADRAETILREKGNTPSLPELVCRHPSDQVLATFFNTRFDGEHALKIFAAQVRGLFGPACTPKKSSASSPKPSSSFPSSPHFSI